MYRIPIEEDFITRQLIGEDGKQNWDIIIRRPIDSFLYLMILISNLKSL